MPDGHGILSPYDWVIRRGLKWHEASGLPYVEGVPMVRTFAPPNASSMPMHCQPASGDAVSIRAVNLSERLAVRSLVDSRRSVLLPRTIASEACSTTISQNSL